jgi:hypothetical protein
MERLLNEYFFASRCYSCGALEKAMLVKKNTAETLSPLVVHLLIEMNPTTSPLEWQPWKNGLLTYSAMDAKACFIVVLPMLSSQMQTGQEMVTLLWVMKSLTLPVS